MASFLKSDLLRNFLGGFVLGTILMFTVGSDDEPVPGDSGRPLVTAALDS